MKLNLPFVNTYFDFDDYNSPVKTYIDGRLSYDLAATHKKSANAFVQVSLLS